MENEILKWSLWEFLRLDYAENVLYTGSRTFTERYFSVFLLFPNKLESFF